MTAPTTDLVRQVLAAMPVVDGHNDLAMALRAAGRDLEGLDTGRPDLHTDLPRLRAGGVGAQFWSAYVPSTLDEAAAVVATVEQIDLIHRLVARYPDTLAPAFTAADVERAIAGGRIASMIGVEGGHSIAGSTGVLRMLARLGMRYLTLTHNDNTPWADSAADRAVVGGLNATGRSIVAELNRIGVLVDLSHTATGTQHAALDCTSAPVIFSHSSARALDDHPRNVDDDVLTRLSGNGGVIQITFVAEFVSPAAAAWSQARDLHEATAVPGTAGPSRPAGPAGSARPTAVPVDPGPRPLVTVAMVADHIDHARQVAGIEHVGLGGDYDGTTWFPTGLDDVSGYPRLLGELAARHWSRGDLEALTGRNLLRVLRDAESVADEPLWPTLPSAARG